MPVGQVMAQRLAITAMTAMIFSKVNSVNYKFAGEIEQIKTKKTLFVLFSKDGHNLKDELSVEDVHNDCIVIKILNRNAI